MAIFVPGTPCTICGRPVSATEERVLFPAFTANEADPLHVFSDSVVHSKCFYEHPLARDAEVRVSEFISSTGPGAKVCEICKAPISDPDDYFGMGFLTADRLNPLYPWNYARFHKHCLAAWNELPRIIEMAQEELRTGRWRGRGMELLVSDLQKHSR